LEDFSQVDILRQEGVPQKTSEIKRDEKEGEIKGKIITNNLN